MLVQPVPPSVLALLIGTAFHLRGSKLRRAGKDFLLPRVTPTPDFVCVGGLTARLFSPVGWSPGLGLLRFEPALQEETLTSFLKSFHLGAFGEGGRHWPEAVSCEHSRA